MTQIRLLLQEQTGLGLHCLSRSLWQATSVRNMCVQNLLLNANADVSGRAKGLNYGTSLYLHPNSVYTRREDSVETVRVHRLV